nr:hypothetical protein [Streptomyces cupreus]
MKTFVDKESAKGRAPSELTRSLWMTLRNTAETGLADGALEFFLKTESPHSAALPASLLISLRLTPPGLTPQPDELAERLAHRSGPDSDVDVLGLPVGKVIRAVTETTMDFRIHVPGGVGYLHLAFSLPLSGTNSPMGNLCEAIAHSLRWVS